MSDNEDDSYDDPYEDLRMYGCYSYGDDYSGEGDRYMLVAVALAVFVVAFIITAICGAVYSLMRLFGWV